MARTITSIKITMVHHVMMTMDPHSVNSDRFRAWCSENNLSYEILMGIKPRSVHDVKPYLTPYAYHIMHNHRETAGHFDTLGPIGCFQSHRRIWEICVKRKEMIWVFEEGVSEYDTNQFHDLEHHHPDLHLLLGHTIPVVKLRFQRRIGSWYHDRGVEPIDKIYYGTKCYRISPRFAQLALQESKTFDLHVDTFLNVLAIYYQKTLATGRTSKNIVTAVSSGRINHAIEENLILVGTLLFVIVFLFILCRLLLKWYKDCRQQKNRVIQIQRGSST
jgi:GR25 family glycosyltransferase involved in LPS biosynthesis